eukprot:CAMPEP_0115555316 /NCGR_PEP_ID=MMETSP0271-20121206/97763_1 /TAXON_ID=71861 /ORGANISM="Scrippsiella trochoidea, Strain CCMP3099" /LENGTH=98 /DNA_ID=CAMNT_0002989103 /DNA_START=20 /DNA_END=313 /DNA_ORIENTATION=+
MSLWSFRAVSSTSLSKPSILLCRVSSARLSAPASAASGAARLPSAALTCPRRLSASASEMGSANKRESKAAGRLAAAPSSSSAPTACLLTLASSEPRA